MEYLFGVPFERLFLFKIPFYPRILFKISTIFQIYAQILISLVKEGILKRGRRDEISFRFVRGSRTWVVHPVIPDPGIQMDTS